MHESPMKLNSVEVRVKYLIEWERFGGKDKEVCYFKIILVSKSN